MRVHDTPPGRKRAAPHSALRGIPPAALGLLTAWCLFAPSKAKAAEPESVPARVILVRPSCDGSELDEDELVRLLEIELRADGVGDVEAVGAGDLGAGGPPGQGADGPVPGSSLAVLRLEGVCDRATTISLAIDDAATDKRVRREVDLGGVSDEARPRAVALAIAELLRASWMELVLPSAPPPRAVVPIEVRDAARGRVAALAGAPSGEASGATLPVTPAMSPAAPPAVELSTISAPPPDRLGASPDHADRGASTASTVWLGGGVGARGFIDGDALFGGLRAEASFPIAPPLRARGGIAAAYSPGEHELGDVDLFMLNGRAALCLAQAGERFMVELGPFVELGWGQARGAPSQELVRGDDASAFIALTGATLGARFALSEALWLDGSLDFGPTLSGLSALVDGVQERSIDGLAGGLHLGLAWAVSRPHGPAGDRPQ